MALSLNILTLNCWGIPLVSKDRRERMAAIASRLALGHHDVVCLQEVWSEADFHFIKKQVSAVLPYTHYFYSGVAGSGLCVLSSWPIEEVFFYQWSLNGYIHKVQHGDWFGGKGVGLCRLRCRQWAVHVYCTHLHAAYSEEDVYRSHRALQALGAAQLVRLGAARAALSVLAGDLNSEPAGLSYRLMTELPRLSDPFYALSPAAAGEAPPAGAGEAEGRGAGAGGTSDHARNSYSSPELVAKQPHGKRIDHILYSAAPGFKAEPVSYGNPFPDRVPGRPFSYSDHDPVALTLLLSEAAPAGPAPPPPPPRAAPEHAALQGTLAEARLVCVEAKSALARSSRAYLVYALSAVVLLVSTAAWWPGSAAPALLRVALTAVALYCLGMATLWHRMEGNSLEAGVAALDHLLKAS